MRSARIRRSAPGRRYGRTLALAGITATAVVVGWLQPVLAAGQIGVVNARVDTRPATRGVAAEVEAVLSARTAAWVGYRVPIARRSRAASGKGWSDTGTCCGRCRLEPATELVVLARAEAGRLTELRASGVDCDLDAGGMPLVWLTGVAADDSVAWLRTLTAAAMPPGVINAAVTAIALHDAPSAAPALVALARTDSRSAVRRNALFWIAQRTSNEAMATITAAIDDDPDASVKKHAVFALSQLPGDESIPKLIDLARSNRSVAVRSQAMFWLGQSNDPRALEFFSAILLK